MALDASPTQNNVGKAQTIWKPVFLSTFAQRPCRTGAAVRSHRTEDKVEHHYRQCLALALEQGSDYSTFR